MSRWKAMITFLKEVSREMFPTFLCRIVGKEVDELTERATFSLKSKRWPTPRRVKTSDIIHDDEYFSALSEQDRQHVEAQYLSELRQPRACIEEYPVAANSHKEYIFKILLLEEKKMVCGTAAYFIKENKKILSLLSKQDTVRLAIAYSMERFSAQDEARVSRINHNVHRLK